jgi:hypothetical protein
MFSTIPSTITEAPKSSLLNEEIFLEPNNLDCKFDTASVSPKPLPRVTNSIINESIGDHDIHHAMFNQ